MIMEILLGGLAGLATYIYLHHLDKKNAEKELQKVFFNHLYQWLC